jgi:hypothetical protein
MDSANKVEEKDFLLYNSGKTRLNGAHMWRFVSAMDEHVDQ